MNCLQENVFSATNKFIYLRSINFYMMESKPFSEFNDGFLNVKYVPLYPSSESNLSKNQSDSQLVKSAASTSHSDDFQLESSDIDDVSDYYEHLITRKRHKLKSFDSNKNKRSKSEVKSHKTSGITPFSMSYICRTPETLGHLLFDKCVDLQVPPGPLLGKLKNGEDIVLEDGRTIKSSDVTSPNNPGSVIIGMCK